jgi:Cu/Zn superoxide dismutase
MIIAVAKFTNKEVKGEVIFMQEEDSSIVNIFPTFKDLPPGNHGFHIHTNSVKKNSSCEDLGPHFNPDKKPHGKHPGDLCFNINKNSLNFQSAMISLIEGNKYCVLGRSLVIHSGEDDKGEFWRYPDDENLRQQSIITGNSGKMIACANILKKIFK